MISNVLQSEIYFLDYKQGVFLVIFYQYLIPKPPVLVNLNTFYYRKRDARQTRFTSVEYTKCDLMWHEKMLCYILQIFIDT